MRSILTFICLCTLDLYAQTPNLSGQWSGTTNTALGTYQVFDIIQQNGLTISGYGHMINLEKTDSAAYNFEGYIKDGNIEIKQIKFNYKTGVQCLAKSKLKFSQQGDDSFLTGRWGANLVKGGCLPGFGGAINLMKVSNPDPSATNKLLPVEMTEIADEDMIGQALADRLQQSNYYALVIGVEEYNGDGISKLDNPIKDAQSLLAVLKANYGFSDQHTIMLQNPTRSDLINGFENLSKVVTNLDQVLIFYAGHGIWDKKLAQGYWLPVDATMDSRVNWLSNSTIRDYLRGIESKHTLLITDACFSGGILKERAVFQNSRAMLELYKMPSRKALTSGTLTTVPDQSVFIKYLVKNLKSNQEPILSSGELFNRFKITVINNSPNGQVPQFGVISQAGDEGGEFIFLKQ